MQGLKKEKILWFFAHLFVLVEVESGDAVDDDSQEIHVIIGVDFCFNLLEIG